MEDNHKKELREYLEKQAEERKSMRKKDPYFMKDRELIMNVDVLRGSKVMIPGETYELDPSRKKQLEYVARAMSQSPAKKTEDHNYLAGRGRTLLN